MALILGLLFTPLSPSHVKGFGWIGDIPSPGNRLILSIVKGRLSASC